MPWSARLRSTAPGHARQVPLRSSRCFMPTRQVVRVRLQSAPADQGIPVSAEQFDPGPLSVTAGVVPDEPPRRPSCSPTVITRSSEVAIPGDHPGRPPLSARQLPTAHVTAVQQNVMATIRPVEQPHDRQSDHRLAAAGLTEPAQAIPRRMFRLTPSTAYRWYRCPDGVERFSISSSGGTGHRLFVLGFRRACRWQTRIEGSRTTSERDWLPAPVNMSRTQDETTGFHAVRGVPVIHIPVRIFPFLYSSTCHKIHLIVILLFFIHSFVLHQVPLAIGPICLL